MEKGATVQDAPSAQHATQQNIYYPEKVMQALNDLASATQNNPHYLGNLHFIPTLALVSSSASGGKFWQGLPTDVGLDIRWGKNGTHGSLLHKARHECKQGNPVLELKERFIKKLNKGYTILSQETFLP